MSRTEVLDHLIRMKHIASDLRAPFYLLLLAFKFSLLLLTLLQLYILKTGLQDSEGILPVVQL